jgi:hypothetical protein
MLDASWFVNETNRIHLVLFGMQTTAFGPYFAVINRILISVVVYDPPSSWADQHWLVAAGKAAFLVYVIRATQFHCVSPPLMIILREHGCPCVCLISLTAPGG